MQTQRTDDILAELDRDEYEAMAPASNRELTEQRMLSLIALVLSDRCIECQAELPPGTTAVRCYPCAQPEVL